MLATFLLLLWFAMALTILVLAFIGFLNALVHVWHYKQGGR